MNNQNKQNNLILSIVAGVLGLIGILVVYFNKPTAQTVPDPEKVPAVNIAAAPNTVVLAAGLPGGDQNQGGGAAAPGAAPSAAPAAGGSSGNAPRRRGLSVGGN